jgi:aspartate/methionine/tyrosine aminotransferase
MRPYSQFLDYVKTKDPVIKYHLGGSTPPVPPYLEKKAIRVPLNTKTYLADLLKLKKTLAKKIGCLDTEINFVPGSTIACTHVLAALTEPGDTIILERPIYEPYVATAKFLGLNVIRFARSDDFEKDLVELKNLAKQAKVLLVSNPHCPTGWFYKPDKMSVLNDLGLTVVVDEVFLPLFSKGQISHKKHFTNWQNMIFISGLSKSTGLGYHRCGWIVAPEETSKKIGKIGLHFQADFPLGNIPVLQFALDNWMKINSDLRKIFTPNKKLIQNFNKKYPGYLSHDFENGFFGMLKIPADFSSGKEFAEKFLSKGILIRDGAHFEMPDYVRFNSALPAKDFKKVFEEIAKYY